MTEAMVSFTKSFQVMKKYLVGIVIVFLIFACQGSALASGQKDVFYPEYLVVADKIDTIFGMSLPTDFVDAVDTKEKIIFFYASVRIMNPSKKKYRTKIVCVDSHNRVVIEGSALQPLQRELILGKEKTNNIYQTLGLNPKPGAMVPGQKRKLVVGGEYFVKLYVEGKLMSITNFRYIKL